VEEMDRNSGISAAVRVGKLSLIDLAGSERACATRNKGKRLLEGANINRRYATKRYFVSRVASF